MNTQSSPPPRFRADCVPTPDRLLLRFSGRLVLDPRVNASARCWRLLCSMPISRARTSSIELPLRAASSIRASSRVRSVNVILHSLPYPGVPGSHRVTGDVPVCPRCTCTTGPADAQLTR